MKFGYFDDANREYVITTPKTPLPWINYLGCNEFFTLISNTCGGYTFYKDAITTFLPISTANISILKKAAPSGIRAGNPRRQSLTATNAATASATAVLQAKRMIWKHLFSLLSPWTTIARSVK